ncbi:23S rRNA methyltransferase [Oscillospiraceae bacterium]|nr:23S rRNA methyltransferase [Oscillospiraceae bacterium]
MPECITSRENAKIKYACKLGQSAAFRAGENAFLAEGYKLCLELAKGCPLKVIYYTCRAQDKWPALQALPCEQYLVEDHVAEKLAGVESPQGVFGVFGRPAARFADLPRGGRFLALERVQDPGNVGALIRSAAAFDFDGVLLSPGCADPFAPKVLRASMGAAGRMPLVAAPNLADALAELASRGVLCLAAALENSLPLGEVDPACPGGVCLVIGSEGQGLSAAAMAACQKAVRIPITDRVESLNASVAGGVLLWHFRGAGR